MYGLGHSSNGVFRSTTYPDRRMRCDALDGVKEGPKVCPKSTGTLRVSSYEIHHESHGEGEPIIFVHGGMGSLREFDSIIPFLSDHFRLLAYDRRGIGRSSGEPFVPDIVHNGADELDTVMSSLGIERAHLYGSCVGGAMALVLAARRPDRVRSVFATGVLFRGSVELRERLSRLFRPWERMPLAFHRTLAAIQGTADPSPFYETFRKIHARGEPAGYASSPDYDIQKELGKIVCPVLAVHGDRDPFWGVDQPVSVYRRIMKSGLWVVPYCGHFPHIEYPDLVAGQALRFFADASRTEGASSMHWVG